MPNLLNFEYYKFFLDYIFHVSEVVFKVPVAERKVKKLLYNFVYVSRAINSQIAQNEIYQQIVNGLQFVWVIERWNHVKQ